MQFYRERDFGELFSDTFDFVKLYGKNYFKNYILLNGMLIILLLVVAYFGFGDFFKQLFDSNVGGEAYFMEEYFQENQGVLMLVFLLCAVLFVVLSLISYSYPVLYLKRISETGAKEVSMNEMVDDIKAKAGRFFKFLLGMIFIITPLLVIVMFISGMLMFLIIGFFLILFILPAFLNIINFSLYHYYHTEESFFNSLGYGFQKQFSKNFWKYWGSVTIFYVIIQIVTSLISSVPMMFLFGSDFLTPSDLTSEDMFMVSFMVIMYGLSFIVSFILSNLIYVNAGLMYYDSRQDLHRDMQMAEIDNIGAREV